MTDLPARPERRASDDDRDQTAADLRDAFAEGRLNPDEYQTRLDAVWQSRTYGELDRLTADLPQPDLRRREAEQRAAKRQQIAKYIDDWKGWGGLAVVLVGIWLISSITTGELRYFWPAWPLGIIAIGMVADMISGDDKKDGAPKNTKDANGWASDEPR